MAKIKVATFNVNNLFERPKIMELNGFSEEGKAVLNDVEKLNELLEHDSYAGTVGEKILTILEKYFHQQSDNPWFKINEIREKLFSRKRDGSGLSLVAKGRDSWLGWVELIKQRTNEVSIENTARVLNAVKAHIVCTVEVDNRTALKNFNDLLLKDFGSSFKHTMLIDGNDDRGIDVGVLSNFEIESMISHIDDTFTDSKGREQKIFSRDCPEFKIKIGNNKYLHLLCNHLKSKGYGKPAESNAKRKRQAERIVQILSKYDLKKDLVIVAGDFNDTPDSEPLKKLISYPNLFDVLNWEGFDGEKWTYHTGKDQIDYMLVSKPLFAFITDVQIERRGIYRRGNTTFPEVTNHTTEASDHACINAVFNIT
jgi:endonuclease/exonuclease/phosphatase family metal-dependent hydrolase